MSKPGILPFQDDALLAKALQHGVLRSLDYAFAQFVARYAAPCSASAQLAAALVSRAVADGHSCLDLVAAAERPSFPDTDEPELAAARNPALEDWLQALEACARVGRPGDEEPLILDGTRLYLHRYWRYEEELAAALRQRAVAEAAAQERVTNAYFQRLEGEVDWQAVAAAVALSSRLLVLAGGPGTGKTYTVLRLLALLLEREPELRIALAAPTGKAAVRITESIRRDRLALPCNETVRARIPDEAATLHRLLGVIPGSTEFRHNSETPLNADVVVVDECSMVDLPLMTRLLRALKPSARLILIGDPDQLASVETGNVLTEICAAGGGNRFSAEACARIHQLCGYEVEAAAQASPLADAVVTLEKSRRFTADSAIGRLARAVQAQDADQTLSLLRDASLPELSLETPTASALEAAVRRRAVEWFGALFEAEDPAAALDAQQGFQLLAAVRRGPWGVEGLNYLIEKALRRAGLVRGDSAFYAGRPIIVTRNDYRTGLFNGDIGIVYPEQRGRGPLRIWFRMPDGELKSFLPSEIGAHETVYAMTIHKSQGSEYDRVLMVLPERESDFLGRELIYTGLSRARKAVEIWSSEPVLRKAVTNRLRRDSGLGRRLKEADA